MVNDAARLGALRFAEKQGGPFLAPDSHDQIPPFVQRGRLLGASERILSWIGGRELNEGHSRHVPVFIQALVCMPPLVVLVFGRSVSFYKMYGSIRTRIRAPLHQYG